MYNSLHKECDETKINPTASVEDLGPEKGPDDLGQNVNKGEGARKNHHSMRRISYGLVEANISREETLVGSVSLQQSYGAS